MVDGEKTKVHGLIEAVVPAEMVPGAPRTASAGYAAELGRNVDIGGANNEAVSAEYPSFLMNNDDHAGNGIDVSAGEGNFDTMLPMSPRQNISQWMAVIAEPFPWLLCWSSCIQTMALGHKRLCLRRQRRQPDKHSDLTDTQPSWANVQVDMDAFVGSLIGKAF